MFVAFLPGMSRASYDLLLFFLLPLSLNSFLISNSGLLLYFLHSHRSDGGKKTLPLTHASTNIESLIQQFIAKRVIPEGQYRAKDRFDNEIRCHVTLAEISHQCLYLYPYSGMFSDATSSSITFIYLFISLNERVYSSLMIDSYFLSILITRSALRSHSPRHERQDGFAGTAAGRCQ
jgi:hypothetical protein